jgi:hypothetical protein
MCCTGRIFRDVLSSEYFELYTGRSKCGTRVTPTEIEFSRRVESLLKSIPKRHQTLSVWHCGLCDAVPEKVVLNAVEALEFLQTNRGFSTGSLSMVKGICMCVSHAHKHVRMQSERDVHRFFSQLRSLQRQAVAIDAHNRPDEDA